MFKSSLSSIVIHLLLILILVVNVFPTKNKVINNAKNNFQKNPGVIKPQQPQQLVQASILDKNIIDAAVKRQETKAKQQQDNIKKQKLQTEKLQKEAKQAKKSLELAKQEQAKIESIKKQAEAERVKAEKIKLEQEKARIIAEKKKAEQLEIDKKQLAARQSWLENEFNLHMAGIEQKITSNRTLSAVFSEDLLCVIRIFLLPDGTLNQVKIVKSSGNVAYDAMSEKAVYKSAPFDMPSDIDLVKRLRDIEIGFKNDNKQVS